MVPTTVEGQYNSQEATGVVIDVADGKADLVSTKLEIIDTSSTNPIPPASIVNTDKDISGANSHVTSSSNDVSGANSHVTSSSNDVSGTSTSNDVSGANVTSSSNSVLGASTAVTQALETLLKTNERPPPTASFFHRLTCVECGIHVHLGYIFIYIYIYIYMYIYMYIYICI
jgi:hypothetical protein